MADYASKGVAGTGLGLAIGATTLSVLNGGLGNLLGGLGNCNKGDNLAMLGMLSTLKGSSCNCNEQVVATRYDLEIMNRLADKDAEILALKSSQDTDRKVLELFRYIDAKDKATGEAIAQIAAAQAVQNQKIVDDMRYMESNLKNAIEVEKNARCCNDNNIVNYVNQTFYSKLIADVTAGTTTTAQATYNPLNKCGCSC